MMNNIKSCTEQARDGLHTPGFQDNRQRDIKKKPVAGGTATGSESCEVNRGHSMLNDSTRALIRKVDVPDTDTKSLNRLVQSLQRKLAGKPVKIKPPKGKAFSSGGGLQVWGFIANQTVQATNADETRAVIDGILNDLPDAAAEVWGRLDAPEHESARTEVITPIDCNNPLKTLEKIIPHLQAAGVYVKEGRLCRVVISDTSRLRGISRLTVSGPSINLHDAESLLPQICRVVDFRITTRGGESKSSSPRVGLMKMLLRLGVWPNTPHLVGIASGPFLRPDGTICITPGYDHDSGWFVDYTGDLIDIPDHPTQEQASKSCRVLMELVDQFEWKSESQRCGFLAYLLTLIARPGIEGNVPAFVFSASTPGAGKSLLVNVANIIAFGRNPSGYIAPTTENADAEWKKSLFAFAGSGCPSLVVTNYPSGMPVGNAVLDAVITESRIVDRPMKTHDMRESAWIAVLAFTGNNLSVATDFAPRAMWAILEPTVENPRERSGFAIADLESYVKEHRDSLLGHALIILRWHAVNGQPKTNGKHLGSFELWSRIVRDPILLLTGHDVSANGKDACIVDEESNVLATLITGLNEYSNWRRKTEQEPRFTITELQRDLNDPANSTAWPELHEIFDPSVSVKAFQSAAGRILEKHKSRVSGGLKLHKKDINRKGYWQIMPAVSQRDVIW